MWKIIKILTILFAVCIFVGCGSGSGNGGVDGGNGVVISGAQELNLNGLMWAEEKTYIQNGDILASIAYSKFMRNSEISSYYGGEGSITNGQLDFNIETPNDLQNANHYFEYWGERYRFLEISNTSAKLKNLELLTSYGRIYRELCTVSKSGNKYMGNYQWVEYVYVDQDVTVIGDGKTYY